MEGIINVLKPPGMSSHDVVSFLRRTLGEKKIGHCGTLDPQAAGVLPLCLGQATRLADYLGGGLKRYYCEMVLGYETDTQDIWGETNRVFAEAGDAPADVFRFSQKEITGVLRSFEGEIMQEIPAYSAVKRGGKSLYRFAREGRPYTGITRKVRIHSLEFAGFSGSVDGSVVAAFGGRRLRFTVECGAGTYVRMLCRDIGRKLGCGGAMAFLLRLRVGAFSLEDSLSLEEIAGKAAAEKAAAGTGLPGVLLLPKELALRDMPCLAVSAEEISRLRQGQPLWLARGALPAAGGKALMGGAYGTDGEDGIDGADEKKGGIKVWAAGEDRRLAAIGLCTPAGGDRLLFKPEKTFR